MRLNLVAGVLKCLLLILTIGIAIAEANPGQALPAGPPGYSPVSSDLATPDPETGTVDGGSYGNKYFDLSYPLLPDWREDFKGPEPSNGGYYVLSAVRPKGELNGSVLVTAQDRFFASWLMRNSLDLLKQRQQQALQSTLTIDGPPREVKITNHSFARLDYSGAGLYHTIFAIDIQIGRAHV